MVGHGHSLRGREWADEPEESLPANMHFLGEIKNTIKLRYNKKSPIFKKAEKMNKIPQELRMKMGLNSGNKIFGLKFE
jgi:hypothetical protein